MLSILAYPMMLASTPIQRPIGNSTARGPEWARNDSTTTVEDVYTCQVVCGTYVESLLFGLGLGNRER